MTEEAKQAILPGEEFAQIPHEPHKQRIVVRGKDGLLENALVSDVDGELHFHYADGTEIGQESQEDLENLGRVYRQLKSPIPEDLQESLREFNIRSGRRNARRKKAS